MADSKASGSNLSAALICLNEEADLPACLISLQGWCSEIVVALDGGTTDRTAEIAQEYGARVVYREWSGWADQKNFAFDKCNGDWILSVDADERIPAELRDEILAVLRAPGAEGYFVARKNLWLGRWIRYGGWYPDYSLRLFKRGSGRARYIAHERIEVAGPTLILRTPLIHDNIKSVDDHVWTMLRSTNAEVDEMIANNVQFYWIFPFRPVAVYFKRALSGRPGRLRLYLLAKDVFKNQVEIVWLIPLLPLLKFLHMYVVKQGFRDGFRGLGVATLSGIYVAIKYLKYWARVRGTDQAFILPLTAEADPSVHSRR